MVELTPDQTVALEKMRTAFPAEDCCGLQFDDSTFLRYLRARTFDFAKSSAMLNATIKWREEAGLGDMHKGWTSIIEKENSTGKMYARGFSKEGHALLYMKPRYENTNDHDGNVKHLIYSMERLRAITRASESNEKIVLLIDYAGFSLANASPMKTSKEILGILQNHYPEMLHCAYCISPPWVFNAFWTVISPFIDPLTKAKVCLIKGDEIKLKLHEKIDVNILETSLGGDDDRPFVSSEYLQADFSRDFSAILNDAKEKYGKPEN